MAEKGARVPSLMCVTCGMSEWVYQHTDSAYVVQITALKGAELPKNKDRMLQTNHFRKGTIMNHTDKAKKLYEQGFYCSQAVLTAFADEIGLTEEQTLLLGSCFGGGMCKGEVCGACTGALMILGMKTGRKIASDWDSQRRSDDLAARFLEEFSKENGSYICNELLGCDISTSEGKSYAREQKLFTEFCPRMVISAVNIIERLIKRNHIIA